MSADSWVSQMRRGMVDFCLLAVLREGEDYGYAIIERLNRAECLVFSESTVYPALGRMTREGLLVSYRAPSRDGPPRRYYALSPAGYERFAAMAAYWRELADAIDALVEPPATPPAPGGERARG